MMNQLVLHIPTEQELEYRRQLISDEETMAYNRGYGDNGSGCYFQTIHQVREWYNNWNNGTDNYYAYIVRSEDNVFIGEVNLHKSKNNPWCEMGIVLEAKYRGLGYSVPALKLLMEQAFENMKAPAVHNDFEVSRVAAVKTHLAAGFKEIKCKNGIIDLLITQEEYYRNKAIEKMTSEISDILSDRFPSVYLFGSVTLDDFKLGWSDIDFLCLNKEMITQKQADILVNLRQHLLESEPDNPYYRSFEGGFLTLDAFLSGQPDRVVYWGTSGQRITNSYCFDSFSMAELLDFGILLCGDDVRDRMAYPSYEMLKHDILHHYEAIRKYAVNVNRSIKSYGWLLDIARCIYTLRIEKIIAKTSAGEWALENNICSVPDALKKAVQVRTEPQKYSDDKQMLDYTAVLGNDIQCFADVLQKELSI